MLSLILSFNKGQKPLMLLDYHDCVHSAEGNREGKEMAEPDLRSRPQPDLLAPSPVLCPDHPAWQVVEQKSGGLWWSKEAERGYHVPGVPC